MKRTIAVDMPWDASAHMGTGVYADTAVRALSSAAPEWTFLLSVPPTSSRLIQLPNVQYSVLPTLNLREEGYRQIALPSYLERINADLLYAPATLLPLIKVCPMVATVHDLAFLKKETCYDSNLVTFLNKWLLPSLKSADHLIAISQQTRQDLEARLSWTAENTTIIEQPVRQEFCEPLKPAQVDAILSQYKIYPPYFLHVSNLAPHKNVNFLIHVLLRLKEYKLKKDLLLVIAGGGIAPNRPPDFLNLAKQLGLEHNVKFVGRLDIDSLKAVYQGCDSFLFPSLTEGWGLPVAEARAFGKPVLASPYVPAAVSHQQLELKEDLWAKRLASGLTNQASSPLPDIESFGKKLKDLFADAMTSKTTMSEACPIHLSSKNNIDLPMKTISPSSPSLQTASAHDALLDTSKDNAISIYYCADWSSPSGFGTAACRQAHALEQQKISVYRIPISANSTLWDEYTSQLPSSSRSAIRHRPKVVLHHGSPNKWKPVPHLYNIGFFVWETDKIPGNEYLNPDFNWMRILEQMNEIWAASHFVKRVYADSGGTRPCFVFPHPIDSDFFSPGPRRITLPDLPSNFDETWTVFLYVGTVDVRKRVDDVIRAYFESFRSFDRTLLILKTYYPETINGHAEVLKLCTTVQNRLSAPHKDLPHLSICSSIITPTDLRNLYRSANAFVTATRGEGFGLCAIEAMSSGIPLIATRFSAMEEYLTDETGYPIPHNMEFVPEMCPFPWFQPDQKWGAPNSTELSSAMKLVHENRAIAVAKGRSARTMVLKNYSERPIGIAMRNRLEEIQKTLPMHLR